MSAQRTEADEKKTREWYIDGAAGSRYSMPVASLFRRGQAKENDMAEVYKYGLIVEGTVTGGGSSSFFDPHGGDYEVEIESISVECFDTAMEHFEDDIQALREALDNAERRLPQSFVAECGDMFDEDLMEAAGAEDAQYDLASEAAARGVTR